MSISTRLEPYLYDFKNKMAVPAFASAFQTSVLGHAGDKELLTFDFTLNFLRHAYFIYILHLASAEQIVCLFTFYMK